MFQLFFHFIYFSQGNIVYCVYKYLYIVNVFKYLLLLSENKEIIIIILDIISEIVIII